MNFGSWDLGKKVIIGSTILAFLSFFFKWVDVGFISQTGFGQGAIYLILAFAYPAIMVWTGKPLNKMIGFISAVIGVILGIVYINSKTIEFFGSSVNAAASGPYVYIASCVILMFGIFKSKSKA
ncbi:hypothetical protein E5161_16230 [Cohnella pontilimi]|uniref:Uncharacterized protein n=1 Tax=Cohnella pontilimi TaxID=2564100 RepID=A0A4U0F8E5_9BACL|nr:hypothetical protein [Cohnella pontilimi]TJY40698.1 hypothetical protein E5161_16230 [Cohnella pontilimi]